MEALEPRILYAADLAATALALTGGDVAAAEQRVQAPVRATPADSAPAGVEIAFVDRAVPQAEALIAGLQAARAGGRPIEVIPIDVDEDGIARIGAVLADRPAQAVTAVHLISHGADGVVQLGAERLDADSLLRRAGEIASWSQALGDGADLLIYGCDVAAGAAGQALIRDLAALSGADVAASDDPTGAASQGGDVRLERSTGAIETPAVQAVAAAGLLAIGDDVAVNAGTAGTQSTLGDHRGAQRAVALDGSGNFIVAWTGQDADGEGVFARRFAADGTALGGDIAVNLTTANGQGGAQVVCDADGRFTVVWTSVNQDGTYTSVYFRQFAADGTPLTGEIRANAYGAGVQTGTAIASTGAGGVVIAWQGDGPAGSSVYFRRFAGDGTALDAADRAVVSGSGAGETGAGVASDGAGRFVVTWSAGTWLYAQRYDADGVAQGSRLTVNNALADSSRGVVAMDAAGRFMVAYREDSPLGPGLWGRAFNADGSNWKNSFYIANGGDTNPSIAMAADGSAWVTWEALTDGDGTGIYGQAYDTSGNPSGSPLQVNNHTAGTQSSASVAVLSDTRRVVVWSGERSADSEGVSARVYAPTPPVIVSGGGGGTATASVAENSTAVTVVNATDAGGHAITYAVIGGADAARFAIDAASGALRFVQAPDREQPADVGADNVYDVIVQASNGESIDTQALAVTVTNVVEPARAVDDTAATLQGQPPLVIDALANDLTGDGAALTLIDVGQPAHGTASIVGNQIVYTPDTGYTGVDTLHYRVLDGSEGVTHAWSLDGTATDGIGGAGGSLVNGPAGTAGVWDSGLAFDGVDDHALLPDVAYSNAFTLSFWFKMNGNVGTGYRYMYSHGTAGTTNSLNVYFIEDSTVTASGAKDVLRTVLVDGNDSASVSDLDIATTGLVDNQWHQYTLTTLAGGGSQVFVDGVLRASGSRGGDAINPSGSLYVGAVNTLSATRFYQGGLDDLVLLSRPVDAAGAAALFTAAPGDEAAVTIGIGAANLSDPVITSGGGGATAALSIAENTTAVMQVSATDADLPAATIGYTITGGADAARFSIDAVSGQLAFIAAPDAEAPTDTGADGVYEVIVQASDGLRIDSQTIQVTVSDIDEFDVSAVSDADPAAETVAENAAVGTAVGFTAQASDADATNHAISYQLLGDAGGRFAIDAATGVVRVAGALDAETSLSHLITVQATSSDGSTAQRSVTIAVSDVDEFDASAISDADAAAETVAENAAVGTAVGFTAQASDADVTNHAISYSLANDAGGRFVIDAATGVIRVAGALDAETATSHVILVQATSSDGSTAQRSVTLAVSDVDEFDASAISDADAAAETVAENAAVGTAVGFTAQASDADVTNHAISYSLANDAGGRFAIDAVTGVVRVAGALDAETATSHVILVQATSSDGSTAQRAVTVAVLPQNDNAPVISLLTGEDPSALVRAENGDAVVALQATDADRPADTLAWRLAGGADAGRFRLDAAGVLRFVAAPDREQPVDVNADNVYEVTVGVTDGMHDTLQPLRVTVADIDEAPAVVTARLAVTEGAASRPGLVSDDVDTPAARRVWQVVPASLAGGWFERDGAAGQAIDRFTQADVDAGMIRFVTDGGEVAPAGRLTLSDGMTTTAAVALDVTFTPVNDAPTLGPVDLGTLPEDGSRLITAAELLATAWDAEGDTLAVTGLQLSGSEGRLTDLGGGQWRFEPSANWHGAVVLTGVVGDGQASMPLRATLDVAAVNDAPVITSHDGAAGVVLERLENATVVGAVTAVDADAQTEAGVALRYAIVGGADAARFHIDATSGRLTFVHAPDREQPDDADHDARYEVVVAVDDGQASARQAISVVIGNVDEAPVLTLNSLLVDEVSVTLQLRATDVDTPTTALVYQVATTRGGWFARTDAPDTAVTRFTQAEIDQARIRFVADGSGVAPAYALQLTDGVSRVAVQPPALAQAGMALTTVTSSVAPKSAPVADDPVTAAGPHARAAVASAGPEQLPAPPMAPSADDALGLRGQADPEPPVGRPAGRVVTAEVVGAANGGHPAATAASPLLPEAVIEDMLSLSSGTRADLSPGVLPAFDLLSSRSGAALVAQLDQLRSEVTEAQQAPAMTVVSTALVSGGVSVGYAIWLLRGGVLMASLMSAVPAWAGMDPLPVLAQVRREGGEDDDEAEIDPIEHLFSKARRLIGGPAGAAVRPSPGGAP